MRTSVWVAIALLVIVIAFGVWSAGVMDRLSSRYISAAEELLVLAQDEQWQRAHEVTVAYRESWSDTMAWLRTMVVHEDMDAVELSLKRIQAGIEAQDQSLCYEGCFELREYADHLSHRNSFTLGNIL